MPSRLTKITSKYSEHTLADYSKLLWKINTSEKITVDPLLLKVLKKYLTKQHHDPLLIERFFEQLSKTPILQTTHHLTPTQGPVFNTVDIVALSGLPNDFIYPVGVCSGTAFSNTAFSGALCFRQLDWSQLFRPNSKLLNVALKSQAERSAHGSEEKRFSLIPSSYRDALVYRSPILAGMADKIDELAKQLKEFLPDPRLFDSYTSWVLTAQQKMQQSLHPTKSMLFFDLNEVVAEYIAECLETQTDHPISEFLSTLLNSGGHGTSDDNPCLFLCDLIKNKGHKVGKVFLSDLLKKGMGLSEITYQLRSGKWCPSVYLVFYSMAYICGIKCLGSFQQCEYLPELLDGWSQVSDTSHIATTNHALYPSLTTGKLEYDGDWIYSLDYFMSEKSINLPSISSTVMSHVWQPISSN